MQHANTYIANLGYAVGDHSVTTLTRRVAVNSFEAAKIEAGRLGPVYHATNPSIEAERFNPAATVMGELGIQTSSHPAVTVTNGDQGVIDALGQAAYYLAACAPDGPTHALITADSAGSSAWPESTASLPRSDGAGAVMVTKQPQRTRLVATATRTHPPLINVHRRRPTNHTPLEGLLYGVLLDVLNDAGITRNKIKHLVTPLGSDRIDHAVAIPQAPACPRYVGYLGSADLIVGMKLAEIPDPWPRNGAYVLLLARGIASVGAAVLQLQ